MSSLLPPKDGFNTARSPSKVVIDMPHTQSASQGGAGGAPVLIPSSSIQSSSPLLKPQRAGSGTHDNSQPMASFEVESAGSGNSAASGNSGSWAQRVLLAPLKRRVWVPLKAILQSGATPEGLALSLAFGVTGGVFPVPATTTVICIAFAFLFKLNVAMVQLVNLLMTPVNLATFLTFIRCGEALFGAQPVALSLEPFKEAPLRALGDFWVSLCYGVVAWAIFTPPATFALYQMFKPVMRMAMAGMGPVKTAAD